MTKDRLLLVLLALVLALGATAGWWLLREAGFEASGSDPVPGAAAKATAEPGAAPALKTRAPDGHAGGEPRARVTADEGEERGAWPFPREQAQWAEVRVVLPRGTPADEQLELYAVSIGSGPNHSSLPEGGVEFGYENVLRCEPTPEGRFRAPFWPGAIRGQVFLRGRYLHLEEAAHLPLPPRDAVVLAPELGGCIRARFVLPAGVDPRDVPPFQAQAVGFQLGSGDFAHRIADVAADLAAELRGLPTVPTYVLSADPQVLSPASVGDLRVAPGQLLERTVQLQEGARVSGRVVDETGAPVEDARVEVEQGMASFFADGGHRSAETDAEGRFELTAVAPGRVRLVARKKGHLEGRSPRLQLADREHHRDVLLRLETGGHVQGVVAWPDGRPAVRARITVEEPVRSRLPSFDFLSAEDEGHRTDDGGRFRVTGLGAGPFVVRAAAKELPAPDGGSRRTWRAVAEDVRPGAELSLTLESPFRIEGRAVDDLGRPVERFAVVVSKPPGEATFGSALDEMQRHQVEGEDGRFALEDLGRGRWLLTGHAAGHGASEPVQVEVPGQAAELALILPRAARVAGVVLGSDGAPVGGARVVKVDEDHQPGTIVLRVDDGDDATASDAQGRFELANLAPGAVALRAEHDDHAPSEPLPLDLAPGEAREGVQLVLRRGGVLTGEVYGRDGRPAPGRQVLAAILLGSDASTTTDAAGAFRFERLAAGTYQVMALPAMDALAAFEEDPGAALQALSMASAEVREGETTHVVLGAAPQSPVRLFGRVRRGGEPFRGMVVAFAEGTSLLSGMAMGNTRDDGSYELTLPGPGDYVLVAGERGDAPGGAESHVRVPAVAEHRFDIELPQGRIAGRVEELDGAPAAGLPVVLRAEGGMSLFDLGGGRTVLTGSDGGFAFDGLAPGRYALLAGGQGPQGGAHGAAFVGGLELRADARLDGLVVRLAEPGSIAGRVVGADGAPVQGATIFARRADGTPLNAVSQVRSNASGRFRFEGVPAGRCTVSARAAGAASRESAPLDVRAGATAEVELALEPGTLLRISVEDAEGETVRAAISVVDAAGRDHAGLLGQDALEAMLTEGFSTTEQRVGPLPPGKYVVSARAGGASASKPVTLTGQDDRRVRLRLE